MTTLITTAIQEQGTAKFTVAFTDETGAAVSLTSGTWKLTDTLGNVVNLRSAVAITPATSVTIVLSGDDLKIEPLLYFGRERILTVQGLYDSSAGNGLKFKADCQFAISDLAAVT